MPSSIVPILTIVVVIWLAMAAGTHQHAKANGKSGLWGVAVLLGGLLGLVLYAISLSSD